MRLRRRVSREHGARHESWRGSRVGRWEVGVESVNRRGTPELPSRRRTVLSRSIARVETRGARIHPTGRHLSNSGSVSRRRLYNCWWRSSTTLV